MKKRLVVTRCDKDAEELMKVTHPFLEAYAKDWNADFMVLDHTEDWMTDYELRHYRILKVYDLFDDYDYILSIDSDVLILPHCPDPFELASPKEISVVCEDVGSRKSQRRGVIKDIQDKFGYVNWNEHYINSGFMIVHKNHKPIFQRINDELWTGFGYDDALLGYNIHKYKFSIRRLSYIWNHMSMFSEPWNNNVDRFQSNIIHYAGAAAFPDNLGKLNSLEQRIDLIKKDIDYISKECMRLNIIKLSEKQGLGSNVYNAEFGIRKTPVIVKAHKTRTGFLREKRALDLNIPFTVKCLGVGDSEFIGNYVILEKLYPLPDKISEKLMLEIATRSLIALRQLWKNNIPWICKLDHIMVDAENTNPTLIDFNDEPLPDIPFYQKEKGEEAIIMNLDCDENGIFLNKNQYPRSGWLAIMKYLCRKNNLDKEVLTTAEKNLIAYEYQSLKDVHQPCWLMPDLLRTETEKDDKNFGRLVPPNRKCHDRGRMIYESIKVDSTVGDTWLDIGCNVGWFCFYLKKYFSVVGVEKDKDKVLFNDMIASIRGYSCEFECAEVNLDYINKMPKYDIISALSTLHLKLVKDKDADAFWDLLLAICEKTNKILFLEFPPHAYKYLEEKDTDSFVRRIKHCSSLKNITQIGVSDANRPILKCIK